MRFKRYLIEKTFSISRDVKYVYENGFDPLVSEIWKQAGSGRFLDFNQYSIERLLKGKYGKYFTAVKNGKSIEFKQILSEKFPSKDSKEATKVHPLVCFCGIFRDGSWYRPLKTIQAMEGKSWDRAAIKITIHFQALNLLLNGGQKDIPKEQLKHLYQEFRPERIKATISHEISHWLNDTNHNYHIQKLLKTVMELENQEILKLRKKDVNLTHFEIDAQIHGLKQLKMQHKKDWDMLTLADIFNMYSGVRSVAKTLYDAHGKDVFYIWQKAIIKRLARENLLGKNMKKFAKIEEIK